jgi:hypothetical protein
MTIACSAACDTVVKRVSFIYILPIDSAPLIGKLTITIKALLVEHNTGIFEKC